jgi:16S rRNA (guanine527-N7)-methyltransferase
MTRSPAGEDPFPTAGARALAESGTAGEVGDGRSRGAVARAVPPAPDGGGKPRRDGRPGLGLPARRPPAATLPDLAARYGLGDPQRDQLAALLELLTTDPSAPTSVRDPRAALEVHIADSLSALDLDPVHGAARVVDIGSGAGLPGLPLAIALPEAHVSLLEASSRKCRFLEVARHATAAVNAMVVCQRAESWSLGHGHHDLAVARALAPAPVVAEYAAPLLKIGGVLVDWRGRSDVAADARALEAAAILGLRREQIVRATPFPGASDHHLHVYVKVRDTPLRFPRRPGIARKRPLPG